MFLVVRRMSEIVQAKIFLCKTANKTLHGVICWIRPQCWVSVSWLLSSATSPFIVLHTYDIV